jgi:heme-degrading monooxygenase HmoA
MGRHRTLKKHFQEFPADDCGPVPAGPTFSRGWIRFRRPVRHPWEVLQFLWMWRKLKRELDRSPGLISFEYRVRLRPLMIGMHVVWRSREDEMHFYHKSSHKKISSWALESPLTPALRLEHFVRDQERRLVRLGGFYVYETETDLSEEIH